MKTGRDANTDKVAFVLGHREGSQGAYGAAGMSEYAYNEIFIKDLMQRLGGDRCKMFKRQNKKGYTQNMRELHERIDRYGAKYAIAFHFNAASTPKANGHEILYWERSKLSRYIAKMFDASYDKHLKNRDRNLKAVHKGRGGGFLRRGKSINVLVEPYFAYHQEAFMPGTEGYEALMTATIEVVSSLMGIDAPTYTKGYTPLSLTPYRYSKRRVSGGVALQRFLNLGGAKLKVDGWTGKKTSTAFKAQTGYYLKGDPRA